jgi:hypothetical protein
MSNEVAAIGSESDGEWLRKGWVFIDVEMLVG